MREVLPYLVVLQSDLLNGLETRLVAPLARRMPPPEGVTLRLSPKLVVQGESLTLLVQECAPVDARALRTPVASLRNESQRIVDALDTVVGGV